MTYLNRLGRACAILALLAPLAAGVPAQAAPKSPGEMRCGWLQNPSPGNWWMFDNAGEWTIGTQGGFQARGLDEVPDLTERDWVVTNGSSYGYGCVCMRVQTDPKQRRITRIHSVAQKPLKVCRTDKKLPKP
ncbi:DUF4087 domain-containing protein [Phenylobacterium sp.]|uniref:DUF4087 domain-containing protein n=1 Tax=Phenylobacterium sp. TaxID=1871053 RepID=UPI00272376C2|nr:DUF4087 domain-containing protein [Phenylobacterium sp.]MDO8799643.1 DUF4087 domain-containing protein [Phenylobacterium sp.]